MAEVDETIPTPEPDEQLESEPTPEPDEQDEEGNEAEEDEQPAEEPAPEPQVGMTDKEMEASRKKLEAEDTRHRNRISEIMGEEAQFLEPCPLCSHFVAGLIFPQVPSEEIVAATRVAIGMPDLSNYQPAKHAHKCPDCEGLGVVLSGSLVQGNVAIECNTCHASGYVVVQQGTGELVAPTPGPTNGVTEPFPGVNPDDPAVKELRARGFTVIPPMQVTAST